MPFGPQIGHGSQRPHARVTCSRTLLVAWQPWSVRPSPTGFEELLSELIARARMLRPHLGSRLVSRLQAYGVRCCTLSCEERCGRMIANPPLPSSRSARVAIRANNRCTARMIPRSWLLERCCERRGYAIRGGRLLSVLSGRRDLQKSKSIGVLSAFLGRGADRRWGFEASYRSKVRWRRAGFPHHRASPRLD